MEYLLHVCRSRNIQDFYQEIIKTTRKYTKRKSDERPENNSLNRQQIIVKKNIDITNMSDIERAKRHNSDIYAGFIYHFFSNINFVFCLKTECQTNTNICRCIFVNFPTINIFWYYIHFTNKTSCSKHFWLPSRKKTTKTKPRNINEWCKRSI